ncbi:transmembrane amino acid transporter protein-domain-containing protein [Globomyces pollinis-pini]|nr:transmembrane amino acid transporter protein-domain-containing protein [Globomyces pollinis-pini]
MSNSFTPPTLIRRNSSQSYKQSHLSPDVNILRSNRVATNVRDMDSLYYRGQSVIDSDDLEAVTPILLETGKSSSVLTSTIDLCNTILGTGIVSLPYAFSTVGLGLGCVIVVLSIIGTWFTLRLLVLSAEITHGNAENPVPRILVESDGEASYSSISNTILSPYLAKLSDIFVGIACFGFAVSYVVSIGDCMPQVVIDLIPDDSINTMFMSILTNRYFWMIVFLIIIIPLTCAKSVDEFWWFSGTALICALYLGFVIPYESFKSQDLYDPTKEPISIIHISPDTIQCIPIFIFAFTCHQNIFTIYKDINADYKSPQQLDHSKISHIHSVIDLSVVFVGSLYMIIGIIGYITFGSNTSMIVLDNYPKSTPILIGRLCYSSLAALSFPIQAHPCRVSIDSLLGTIFDLDGLGAYEEISSEVTDSYFPRRWCFQRKYFSTEQGRRISSSITIIVLAYTCAFLVPHLEMILVFVGATGGVIMCYILPCVFYCNVTRPNEHTSWKRIFSIIIAILAGLCGMLQILSLFINIE